MAITACSGQLRLAPLVVVVVDGGVFNQSLHRQRISEITVLSFASQFYI